MAPQRQLPPMQWDEASKSWRDGTRRVATSETKLQLPHGFRPRWYQARIMKHFDEHPDGRAAWCVHRRGGKDLTMVHQAVKMSQRRVGQYWHVYPMYAQARKAIWMGMRKDGVRFLDAFPREIVKSKNKQTMTVEMTNGSIWMLVGSDNVDSVVGSGPVGIVFSEYALCNPSAWDFLSPILVENGGWAAFISTPRGKNHFWDLYDGAERRGWYQETHRASDTGVLPPDIVERQIAEGMPPELARQEYECDWNAAPSGTVWGDLLLTIATKDFELENSEPIFASWDLGHTDATAVWFWQAVGDEFRFLDYHEATRKPLSYYFDMLEKKGWPVACHYLPHDARAQTLQSSSSIMEQFVERVGIAKVAITPSLSIQDGIQAARWLLQKPLRFHTRCAYGLKVLNAYRYGYDEEKKVYSTNPVHDWASNGADAFRYSALMARPNLSRTLQRQAAAARVIEMPRNMYSFTLDDLWKNCAPARSRRM